MVNICALEVMSWVYASKFSLRSRLSRPPRFVSFPFFTLLNSFLSLQPRSLSWPNPPVNCPLSSYQTHDNNCYPLCKILPLIWNHLPFKVLILITWQYCSPDSSWMWTPLSVMSSRPRLPNFVVNGELTQRQHWNDRYSHEDIMLLLSWLIITPQQCAHIAYCSQGEWWA